ncbi:nucleotide sugar transporter SLC35D1-like [Symsagittifera roscoffensis]|uniref:nucleotide sugar transporter SLC35D1-like n=1 Tax=Symsagittifera roscoffensis TaxID=84072 RepID=UPI00307BE8AE
MVSGISVVLDNLNLKTAEMNTEQMPASFLKRLLSAGFYAMTSILIIVCNKSVLTVYNFPSSQVLAVGQMVFSILLLGFLGLIGKIYVPWPSFATFQKIWPLPLLYCGNLFSGLGGTKELSLPMMTVLRRFSVFMILVAEIWILNASFSNLVYFSVGVMIVGAIIAAVNDLSFNLAGYCYILVNNLFTTVNGVVTKQKLDVKELGKYAIIFYNSLFMIIPAVCLAYSSGEVDKASKFDQWTDVGFLLNFLCSCGMGFVLMYSIVLCTQYTSALTVSVIGCTKNVFIAYFGMVFGGDYVFSWPNFWGLTISVMGSLIYAYATFKPPSGRSANSNTSKA